MKINAYFVAVLCCMMVPSRCADITVKKIPSRLDKTVLACRRDLGDKETGIRAQYYSTQKFPSKLEVAPLVVGYKYHENNKCYTTSQVFKDPKQAILLAGLFSCSAKSRLVLQGFCEHEFLETAYALRELEKQEKAKEWSNWLSSLVLSNNDLASQMVQEQDVIQMAQRYKPEKASQVNAVEAQIVVSMYDEKNELPLVCRFAFSNSDMQPADGRKYTKTEIIKKSIFARNLYTTVDDNDSSVVQFVGSPINEQKQIEYERSLGLLTPYALAQEIVNGYKNDSDFAGVMCINLADKKLYQECETQ